MYSASKLIASTDGVFALKNNSHAITVDFINNYDIDTLLMQLRSDGFHSGKSLSLHFENLRGNDLLPIIDIYLNLDQETPDEKNYVGAMALYGLGETTEFNEHNGTGQEKIFEAGKVFNNVSSQPGWSNKQFEITLIPNHALPAGAILTIGRIALYYYEI